MLCGLFIKIWNLANHMSKQNKKHQNDKSIGEKLKSKGLCFIFLMWFARLFLVFWKLKTPTSHSEMNRSLGKIFRYFFSKICIAPFFRTGLTTSHSSSLKWYCPRRAWSRAGQISRSRLLGTERKGKSCRKSQISKHSTQQFTSYVNF